jgi:phenylacetate-CoA ligase
MSGYGLFTAPGIHYGAERLGCLTIPAGAGNSMRQIKLIMDFHVTAVHIIPSYALHLANVVPGDGQGPRDLPSASPWSGPSPIPRRPGVARAIYDMKVYIPTAFGDERPRGGFECPEQNGMHLWETPTSPRS